MAKAVSVSHSINMHRPLLEDVAQLGHCWNQEHMGAERKAFKGGFSVADELPTT